MLTKKANIDPAVRAKLEELGVDTVRSKLVWIMNVRDLAQHDELQPLGAGCQLRNAFPSAANSLNRRPANQIG
jgi:hypothetical protein